MAFQSQVLRSPNVNGISGMRLFIVFLVAMLPLRAAFSCADITIPESVKSYINNNNMPYVIHSHKVVSCEKCKCHLMGDFTGDGVDDYAALLKSTKDGLLHLVTFASMNDSYVVNELGNQIEAYQNVIWVYLRSYPAGIKLSHPTKSITELPSIVYSPMESCETVYHWINGKFSVVYIDEESEC